MMLVCTVALVEAFVHGNDLFGGDRRLEVSAEQVYFSGTAAAAEAGSFCIQSYLQSGRNCYEQLRNRWNQLG